MSKSSILIFLILLAKFEVNFAKVNEQAIDDAAVTNTLCSLQLAHYHSSLGKNESWARQMQNAWGKFPSGIFSGNVYDFGSFDQCIDLRHESEVGNIAGQYCLLMVPFDVESSHARSLKMMTPSRR